MPMQSQPDFSYDQLADIIRKSYQELYSNLGRCNILIIGQTGVGKSTLINAAFRDPIAKNCVGKPVTQDIRQHSKDGFPITVYDTPGLEINGQQIERITQYVSNLIENKLFNFSQQIHVIWYCINHNSNRLEDR
ncbi:MAG: GTPase, partial [Chroococcales cyanobacterium]